MLTPVATETRFPLIFEAARQLGVHRITLYRALCATKIDPLRRAKLVAGYRNFLLAYLDEIAPAPADSPSPAAVRGVVSRSRSARKPRRARR